MAKVYRHCQSCGMPLKKDPLGGGTNVDGSKSIKYCSHCLQNGEFQNPEINSAAKMQSFVKDKLRSMGIPRLVAGFFTKGIPKLERWSK